MKIEEAILETREQMALNFSPRIQELGGMDQGFQNDEAKYL